MQKTFFRLTVVTLLLLMVVPLSYSSAQETQTLTNVFDVGDGYIISAPDGWQIEQDEETGGFLVSNDEVTLLVLNPVQVSERVEVDTETELDDLLIDLYDDLYDDRPRRRDIEPAEIGGREAVTWAYEDGRFDGVFYVIRLSDNSLGAVDAYSQDVAIADVIDVVTAVVTSFDVGEGGQVVAPPASVEPCFISTSDAETVQLRVGPGSNRTVVAFLEADEEFAVAGRFTDDDGDVWYQLNKEEVLPNSAANEIWVAADAVDETGDCDQVVDASAPPIVPISNQPPPTSGDDTSGGGTTGGSTATIIPLSGRWTVNLASTTSASCAGTQTVTFDSSEVFPGGLSFTVSISSVAANGSTLVLNGDTYTLQGNGFYIGPSLFNLVGLDNSQTYIMATSPTSMTGTVVANIVVSGRGCSQSTGISLSR